MHFHSRRRRRPPSVIIVSLIDVLLVVLIFLTVTIDRLQSELIKAATNNPQIKVAIKADKAAPWGEVLRVIDIAKLAKVGSIDAVTQKLATP